MAYRLSEKAADDVVDIYIRGVSEFGIPQAEKYHKGLHDIFDFLAVNPRATREGVEFSPPVHIHSFVSHVIIYVIEDTDILIVRVLHGRQDWERHL